jgi:hypothetical protein
MGLFDKIKHGLKGSGVHTEIAGPDAVSNDQPAMPLTIAFTAKEAPVVLDGFVVTLERQVERDDSDEGDFGGMNDMDSSDTVRDGPTVVVAQDTMSIQLQPGVPVSFNLEVPLDSFAAEMRQHAGRLGAAFADIARADEQIEYIVYVKAPVQGTSHHAHASHTVMVRTFGFRL